ncbi:MAG TPA: T9SS type A sorting domain-containing protein [Bacteroidia bacterium]|jgi:hypothetical protein|nr:T9SS type A sorting domain-containing protein [Bacteroidia bacterium]
MKKGVLSILILGIAVLAKAQSPAAQPPNAGMEVWGSNPTLNEPQEPTGWVSENVFCSAFIGPTNPVSVTQYAPAFAGSHAAQIKTVVIPPPSSNNPAYPTIPDTVGELVLGTVQISSPYLLAGAAYTDKPMTFTFQSKYTAVGLDSAYVVIRLSQYSGGVRNIIALNAVNIPPSAAYTAQSFNLTYFNSGIFPDSLAIAFYSSYHRKDARANSVLVIDSLHFSGTVGIEEYQNLVHFNTYPNPAHSVLNITTDAKLVDHVSVCDLSGRLVENVRISSDYTVLNTSNYPAGMYMYNAINKEGVIQARGKFSVTK